MPLRKFFKKYLSYGPAKHCNDETWRQFADELKTNVRASTLHSCGIITTNILGNLIEIESENITTRISIEHKNGQVECDICRNREYFLVPKKFQTFKKQQIALSSDHAILSNQEKLVKSLFENRDISCFFKNHFVERFVITPSNHALGSWHPYGLNRILVITDVINELDELRNLVSIGEEIITEVDRFNK